MDRIITSNLNCPQLQQKGSDWWYHPTPPPDGGNKSAPTEATEESGITAFFSFRSSFGMFFLNLQFLNKF